MKRTEKELEKIEKEKRIISCRDFWRRGYDDKRFGEPFGYSFYGEPTEEEKDAYLAGWDEAYDLRSDKCQKTKC